MNLFLLWTLEFFETIIYYDGNVQLAASAQHIKRLEGIF